PSMDILISSNLERLIFRLTGEDAKKNASFMKALSESGKYEITDDMRKELSAFYGGFATEEETAEEIKTVYENAGYIIDTHTAVASRVYRKYKEETGDNSVTVIASTASPYKFTRSVMKAIGKDDPALSDLQLTDKLCEVSGVAIPNAIKEIKDANIRHTTECDIDKMPETVKDFLK
ncbi:MAG: threonine synthase, partial [Lachnospiraceae bacterium]|nr:threonine synthase [Lachnospiraceae bacterium]